MDGHARVFGYDGPMIAHPVLLGSLLHPVLGPSKDRHRRERAGADPSRGFGTHVLEDVTLLHIDTRPSGVVPGKPGLIRGSSK